MVETMSSGTAVPMLAASLSCLHAASLALTWELEAGDALPALSSSDVPSVRMPGQGIMLYIFKEKHAADRILAKWTLASNKHFFNEICRHSNAPAAAGVAPRLGH